MKSLFKTVALITAFSVITRVVGFFFRIYLSRVVGAEALGMYQVAFSIFMVLMTFISSGLPLIISRMGSSFSISKQHHKEGSLISTALLYGLMLSCILCLVVLLFRNVFAMLFTDERCLQILIVMLPSLIFSAVYSVFRGAMWGRDNYFALCASELYEQIVRILACVILFAEASSAIENAFNVAYSLNIACLFSMLFVVVLFFFYGGKMSKPSKQIFKPLFKQSTPITCIRVAGSFIQPLVALILPAKLMSIGYTSSQALSLYGIAVGMTLPLLFVPNTIIGSLSTALIPDMSKAMVQNDQTHIENRVRSSIIFSLFISALFIPAYLGLGELAGIFLYDNITSGTLLQASSFVLLPLGLTNITSSLLNSLGMEVKSFKNFICGTVVMFVAIWFLPSLIGINAFIWGMGASYLVTAILNLVMLKKKTGIKLKLGKTITLLLLAILPSGALTGFVVGIANHFLPLFFTLVLGGGVSVLSFVLLCGAFGLIDIKAVFVRAKDYAGNLKLKKKRKKA